MANQPSKSLFVPEPQKDQGVLIPLFDRLADEALEEETEVPIRRFYTQSQLMDSIHREVTRLFNTRCVARWEEVESFLEEALDRGLPPFFGLPDFSHFDGANSGDYDRIARICEKTLSYFEPRLSQISVKVLGFTDQNQGLSLILRATVTVAPFQQEITFPIQACC